MNLNVILIETKKFNNLLIINPSRRRTRKNDQRPEKEEEGSGSSYSNLKVLLSGLQKLQALLSFPFGLLLPLLIPPMLTYLLWSSSTANTHNMISRMLDPPSYFMGGSSSSLLPFSPSKVHSPPTSHTQSSASHPSFLSLTIPFITLPWQATILWAFTMVLSTIWHEFGHALAAAAFGVPMISSGFMSFLILPAAFVALDTRILQSQSAWKQISIAGAGALHNFGISLFAWRILMLLPYLLSFLGYESTPNRGPLILKSATPSWNLNSATQALDGVRKGYYINAINDIPIKQGGLVGYRSLMREIHSFAVIGPFRCLTAADFHQAYHSANPRMNLEDEEKEDREHNPCCMSRSINISEGAGVQCLWDRLSLERYATLQQQASLAAGMNVIPRKCIGFNAPLFFGRGGHDEKLACVDDSDCKTMSNVSTGNRLDATCMAPFTFGREKVVALELISTFASHGKSPFNLTFIGNPGILESTRLLILNLLPAFGLDGARALFIVPDLLKEIGYSHQVEGIRFITSIYSRISEALIIVLLLFSLL